MKPFIPNVGVNNPHSVISASSTGGSSIPSRSSCGISDIASSDGSIMPTTSILVCALFPSTTACSFWGIISARSSKGTSPNVPTPSILLLVSFIISVASTLLFVLSVIASASVLMFVLSVMVSTSTLLLFSIAFASFSKFLMALSIIAFTSCPYFSILKFSPITYILSMMALVSCSTVDYFWADSTYTALDRWTDSPSDFWLLVPYVHILPLSGAVQKI